VRWRVARDPAAPCPASVKQFVSSSVELEIPRSSVASALHRPWSQQAPDACRCARVARQYHILVRQHVLDARQHFSGLPGLRRRWSRCALARRWRMAFPAAMPSAVLSGSAASRCK
jgi:hypothetical protein